MAVQDHNDPRYKPELREQARKLYEEAPEGEGLSVRGVAERMGVSTRRAWQLCRDAGCNMRPEGGARKQEASP